MSAVRNYSTRQRGILQLSSFTEQLCISFNYQAGQGEYGIFQGLVLIHRAVEYYS